MKKVFLGVTLLSLLTMMMVPAAIVLGAVEQPTESLPTKTQLGTLPTKTGIESILEAVVNWVFAIMVVVGTIFIILAGFQFVTAGGDPEKVSEARMKLIWGIAGFGVAVLARAILPLVKSLLGIT